MEGVAEALPAPPAELDVAVDDEDGVVLETTSAVVLVVVGRTEVEVVRFDVTAEPFEVGVERVRAGCRLCPILRTFVLVLSVPNLRCGRCRRLFRERPVAPFPVRFPVRRRLGWRRCPTGVPAWCLTSAIPPLRRVVRASAVDTPTRPTPKTRRTAATTAEARARLTSIAFLLRWPGGLAWGDPWLCGPALRRVCVCRELRRSYRTASSVNIGAHAGNCTVRRPNGRLF